MPTTYTDPEALLGAVRAAGHVVFDKGAGHTSWDLQIVGVRALGSDGKPLQDNAFNDRIYVVCRDDGGTLRLWSWPATTDPGTYWRQNPGRAEGTAILKAGQYRGAWALGLHKGEKPALVQSAPVTVWRDADRDAEIDIAPGTSTQTGIFGINIHRAGTASTLVDKWSAGCQVFARDADFEAFLALCRKQAAKGKGWQKFTYTLLEA